MKKPILLLAAALAGLAAPAGAVTVMLEDTVADPLGTRFVYGGTYAFDPDTGRTSETMVPGAQFIIFDFKGYVDGTIVSGNPLVGASIEMISAIDLLPPGAVDDPNIENLVFTWTGDPFTPPPDYSFTGYGAVSTYADANMDTMIFSSLTQSTTNGAPLYMLGYIGGPVGPAPAVPEPATWAMLVLGFGIVGAGIRNRGRRIMTA